MRLPTTPDSAPGWESRRRESVRGRFPATPGSASAPTGPA